MCLIVNFYTVQLFCFITLPVCIAALRYLFFVRPPVGRPGRFIMTLQSEYHSFHNHLKFRVKCSQFPGPFGFLITLNFKLRNSRKAPNRSRGNSCPLLPVLRKISLVMKKQFHLCYGTAIPPLGIIIGVPSIIVGRGVIVRVVPSSLAAVAASAGTVHVASSVISYPTASNPAILNPID
jgi:hypothetical protein